MRDKKRWSWTTLSAVLACILVLGAFAAYPESLPLYHSISGHPVRPFEALQPPYCRPQLPDVFGKRPIQRDDVEVKAALDEVDTLIRRSFNQDDGIDGLAAAVVTSGGSIYEINLGPLKANESDPSERGHIDRDSIFRIASGSKLFATLETLILREKGALQLDDPLDKYLPAFSYKNGGWTPHASSAKKDPITLRQLASHMSGLGREYPRGNMPKWPHAADGAGPPPDNGEPFPNTEEMVKGIAEYPLIQSTSVQPVYSNAGISLLGQAALAANLRYETAAGVDVDAIPSTYRELVRRDIFEPLDLNGSYFLVNPQNKDNIAVAKQHSDEVDIDFLDPSSASGGQMSSLSDYIRLMQTILDPTRPESLLPPHVVREWLMPMYGFIDDNTEVGLIWEIQKIKDSYSRPVRLYAKHGALYSSHSVFAVNRDMSYGVAWMDTGTSPSSTSLIPKIFQILQPALDKIIANHARDRYAGTWRLSTEDHHEYGVSEAVLQIDAGTLWVEMLTLNGTDVLKMTQESSSAQPVPLWTTGREGEFRVLFGSPRGRIGCLGAWGTVDEGFSNGYPMDLVYFVNGDEGRLALHVPSVGVVLERA